MSACGYWTHGFITDTVRLTGEGLLNFFGLFVCAGVRLFGWRNTLLNTFLAFSRFFYATRLEKENTKVLAVSWLKNMAKRHFQPCGPHDSYNEMFLLSLLSEILFAHQSFLVLFHAIPANEGWCHPLLLNNYFLALSPNISSNFNNSSLSSLLSSDKICLLLLKKANAHKSHFVQCEHTRGANVRHVFVDLHEFVFNWRDLTIYVKLVFDHHNQIR